MIITKQNIGPLRNKLDDVLRDFAKKNGLAYKPASVRYDSSSFAGRVSFIVSGKEAVVANQYGAGTGFSVGDKVTCGGQAFTVVDFTKRGRAIIKRMIDGKRFRAKPWNMKLMAKAPAGNPKLSALKPGDVILAQYPDGDWYPAELVKRLGLKKFKVVWADGDQDNTIVKAIKAA